MRVVPRYACGTCRECARDRALDQRTDPDRRIRKQMRQALINQRNQVARTTQRAEELY